MYDVSKMAKLKYSIIKGSVQKRDTQAENLSKAFYRNFVKKISGDRISLSSLKDVFIKTVPERVGISFLSMGKNESDYDGFMSTMIRGKNKKVCGYQVYLPTDESGKNLKVENANVLFHEVRHVFDSLVHPKAIRRQNYISPDLQVFYDNTIYVSEKIKTGEMKAKIDGIIKGLSTEEKIDFLQFCKNELSTEINAFTNEKLYSKLRKTFKNLKLKTKRFDDVEYFHLKDRLKLIKKILKNELSLARAENKKLYG